MGPLPTTWVDAQRGGARGRPWCTGYAASRQAGADMICARPIGSLRLRIGCSRCACVHFEVAIACVPASTTEHCDQEHSVQVHILPQDCKCKFECQCSRHAACAFHDSRGVAAMVTSPSAKCIPKYRMRCSQGWDVMDSSTRRAGCLFASSMMNTKRVSYLRSDMRLDLTQNTT